MPAAAFPAIVDAVRATAAPFVRTTRGRDISGEIGDVVMVGVQGLDDRPGWDSAGSFDQTFQTFGGARDETGHVNGIAWSRNGEGDQSAATLAAFALIADLGAAIRATPALGVAGFDYLVTELETGEVRELLNDQGATTSISFVVRYKARVIPTSP